MFAIRSLRLTAAACVMFASVAFAQEATYEAVYRSALDDSTITADEAKLLLTLQMSLGIEEEVLLDIQRRVGGTDEAPRLAISRAGRRRIIWNNMTYGNGLYGPGLAYLLDVNDSKIWTGMQMLSFAGGLYLTMQYTDTMDLPVGRANFQISGALLGTFSLYPLIAMVGFERWDQFDKNGKFALTYHMVAVPVGGLFADRLYKKLQPSDGQSTAIIGGAGIGAMHAFLGQLIATPVDVNPGPNWVRLNSLLVSGGIATGAYVGWRAFEKTSLTTGDAYFLGLFGSLSMINYFELLAILELDSHRTALSLFLLSTDLHLYLAYRLGMPYDLTMGETAIMGMGAMAGNATFRGIALIMGLNQGGKGMLFGDILTRMAGVFYTYRALDPRADGSSYASSRSRLTIAPTLLVTAKKTVPGINLSFLF